MTVLPDDADALSVPDHYVHATPNSYYGVRFYVYSKNPYGYEARQVGDVLFPEQFRLYSLNVNDDLRHKVALYSPGKQDAKTTLAMAEVLGLMGTLASILDEGNAEAIARLQEQREEQARKQKEQREAYERERQERFKQMAIQRAKLEARRVFLYDMMKWHIGERIKCRRDGYRQSSHPQGTIDRVDERGLHITTEKGKYMSLKFVDINKLWIKYEDSKRYEELYNAGDEPAPTTEEEVKT